MGCSEKSRPTISSTAHRRSQRAPLKAFSRQYGGIDKDPDPGTVPWDQSLQLRLRIGFGDQSPYPQ
jgi:hypothetical protein